MFKNRKEAKELRTQEANDSHAQEEKQFDAVIQKADQITDPAEKVIALKKVSKDIASRIAREKFEISAKTGKKAENAEIATLGTSLLAGTGLFAGAALAFPPVGAAVVPVVLVGLFGHKIVGNQRRKSVRKKLEGASKTHLDRLNDKAVLASKWAEETVEENVEKISQSPLSGQVRALPGIADKFAEVAAKHIADAKAAAEAGSAAVPEGKRVLRPARKPTDYRGI